MKLRDVINVPTQIYVLDESQRWVPITMPYLGITYDHVIRAIPEILDCGVVPSLSTPTKVFVTYRIKGEVSVSTTVEFSTLLDEKKVSITGRHSIL